MRKKYITYGIVLIIIVLITLYVCNTNVQEKFGALKSDFTQRYLTKNLISTTKETIATTKSTHANRKTQKYIKIDNKEILDVTKEEIDNFHDNNKKEEKKDSVLLKDTDEVTSEEIERFHKNEDDIDSGQENEEPTDKTIKDDDSDEDNEKLTTKMPKDDDSDSDEKEDDFVLQTSIIPKKGEYKKRYPQVIIAGVKKSGTRALLSFLAKHPLVNSAGHEIHFFDRNESYAQGLDWYLDQMPKSYENEITIEKTPGYYIKPYVPKRIYNISKSVKLIFIYKDPVERAISDYTQSLVNKQKKTKKKKIEKLIYTKTKPRKIDSSRSIVSIGMYSKHLLNWLHYFPKVQMHFVNGDEFIKNPVPGIISVQKFLNLPVLINQKNFVYNSTKKFYCFRTNKEDGKTEEHCLSKSKGRSHPFVKEQTIKKLTEFYKPYNKRFFEMINENYGWPTSDKD